MRIDEITLGFVGDGHLGLVGPWANVSMREVNDALEAMVELGLDASTSPSEFEAVDTLGQLVEFLQQLDPDFSGEDLLSIHLTPEGIVDRVLGPAIMADDSSTVVLAVGKRTFPIELDKLSLSLGRIDGDIECRETEAGWLVADAELAVGSHTLTIPVVLSKEASPTKAQFKAAAKSGKLGELLRTVGSGGGGWISMNELDVGEYPISDIVENPEHPEYGKSWSIYVTGFDRPVRSKGKKFERLLHARAAGFCKLLQNNQQLTLAILNKTELAQGTRVDATIVVRQAQTPALPHAFPALKSAQPVAGVDLITALPISEKELDDIPF